MNYHTRDNDVRNTPLHAVAPGRKVRLLRRIFGDWDFYNCVGFLWVEYTTKGGMSVCSETRWYRLPYDMIRVYRLARA